MDVFCKWVNDKRTWAFKVDAFGKCLSSDEQRTRMNFFAPLFTGTEKVDLANPDTTLTVAEVRCLYTTVSLLDSAIVSETDGLSRGS